MGGGPKLGPQLMLSLAYLIWPTGAQLALGAPPKLARWGRDELARKNVQIFPAC